MTNPPKIYATPRKWLRTALLCFLSLALGVGVSMAYTNYVDRKSNRIWCDLIGGMHKRYEALPPNAAPEAIEFAADLSTLWNTLRKDC